MPIYTYEDVNPSLIENTTMQKVFRDGVHSNYTITPVDGYVLHDKGMDEDILDDEGNETGEVIPGYRIARASVGASYDFSTTQVVAIDGSVVNAYGSREFYAILASVVPEDQIHGTVNPPVTE